MKDRWTVAKRAAGALSLAVPALTKSGWIVALIVGMAAVVIMIVLIMAVCWMARYTDAARVWTPVFAWWRKASEPSERSIKKHS